MDWEAFHATIIFYNSHYFYIKLIHMCILIQNWSSTEVI